MKLLYFDETAKIMALPDEGLPIGYSKQSLLKQQEKENAALLVCAASLGINHLVMELVDSLLVDLLPKLKSQKWFKFKIKKNIIKSSELIKDSLQKSYKTSRTPHEYMMEISDELTTTSKDIIFKLTNAVNIEIGRVIKSDHSLLDQMIVIGILLSWINSHYESVLESMNKVYPALYDSWFSEASASIPRKLWNEAIEVYSKQLPFEETLDINNSQLIITGWGMLNNWFTPTTIQDKILPEITVENTDSPDDLTEAYRILGF